MIWIYPCLMDPAYPQQHVCLQTLPHWATAPVARGLSCWTEDDANFGGDLDSTQALQDHLKKLNSHGPWHWPSTRCHFVSDLHADARAFVDSITLAELAKQTGPAPQQFHLLPSARTERLIIGGDCFDKGPSTLSLLDTIARYRALGGQLELLAGNHDLRLPLGLSLFGKPTDTWTEHLFVRMGKKTLPLLKEIWDKQLAPKRKPLATTPDKKTCRARLLPADDWPARFRTAAAKTLSGAALDREISRIISKRATFKADYKSYGLSIRKVYAAAQEAHRLFIQPHGDYAWFLRDLKLASRHGSFLFVHAGLDDKTAMHVVARGVADINDHFTRQFRHNPFAFYAGSLGNTLRTKYRSVDYPLHSPATDALHREGIFAVVHGHRSQTHGQRLSLRSGLLHVECDVTLDRNSRAIEGLSSRGAGITTLHPDGFILASSSDCPTTKLFSPSRILYPSTS